MYRDNICGNGESLHTLYTFIKEKFPEWIDD